MAHTPGQWVVDGFDRFSQGEIIRADGKPIATVYDFNRYDRDAEREANAALIAAAPQLLEACQTAFLSLNLLHEIYQGDGPKPDLDRTWQIAAMASLQTHDAIAKAERKQEPQ